MPKRRNILQDANRRFQRQARRRWNATPLAQIARHARRGGKAYQARLAEAVKRSVGSAELAKMEKAGGIIKFALGQDTKRTVDKVLRALGPLGEVFQAVLGPKKKGAKVLDSQLEQAIKFVEAFGYKVAPGGSRGGTEKAAIDAIEKTGWPGDQPPDRPPRSDMPVESPTLGRGEFAPPSIQEEEVFGKETKTPESSNVYSFSFSQETRRSGILYVTFKAWAPGVKERNGRGPMYAYFDVPVKKFVEFRSEATGGSAGGAVWDYLRQRGSSWRHQHQYRLMQGAVMPGAVPGGVYIPRKVTARGFRTRSLPVVGTGRRAFRKSTLPEALRQVNRAAPDRGEPNRGEPDRG